ncbi:MAG: hypothetical protein JWO33_271 [Caulobacteraceae bacterium]|nr:hypothetical protein [Caulobacteraceae bacterium]
MAEFDIAGAALCGLRMLFARPRVLIAWMIFNLIGMGLYLALLYFLFGDVLKQILDLAVANQEPPAQLFLQLLPRLGLMILILVPLAMLYSGIQRAAAARAMLAPEDDKTGYLRVGGDEFRVIVVNFVVVVIRVCVQIGASIIVAIVLGILLAVTGNLRQPENLAMLRPVINVLIYPVVIFFYLKFALAVPQTVDTRTISIFEAWRLSQGHTWRMFLSYVIIFLITLGIGIAVAAVCIGLAVAIGGAGLMSALPLFETNPQEALRQLMVVMVPLSIAFTVISAIVTPFFTALWYCPPAYIYAAIAGRQEEAF